MGRPLLKELGTRRISIAGEVLEVRMRKSSRARQARITLAPGRPVEVVLARGMSEAEAVAFLTEKRGWIRAKSAELTASARRPRLGLDRPGVVWLGGEAVPVERGGRRRPPARPPGRPPLPCRPPGR